MTIVSLILESEADGLSFIGGKINGVPYPFFLIRGYTPKFSLSAIQQHDGIPSAILCIIII